MTLHFIWIWDCTEFRGLTITRQGNTCISNPKLVTYRPEQSVEKPLNLNHFRRDKRPSCFYTARNPTHGIFPPRITATSTRNPPSATETPCPSVLGFPVWLDRWWHCCQSASTPTRTRQTHAIGACTQFPVSWLANAAVNHASAREPESPVGSDCPSHHLTLASIF